MKILIIEDDLDIARQLSTHLNEDGFVTHVAHDGEEGHYLGETGEYQIVLLDIGLPIMDGFSVLERWRAAGRTMPVIILTARTHKMETIRGLEAGADDYIHKPFDLEEVTARIHSNIRRHTHQLQQVLVCKHVRFDMRTGRVSIDNKPVKLTNLEFRIVRYLFIHQGKRVSISEISDNVYEDFEHDSPVIPRHIANIRKKLGEGIIETESNRGYYVPKDTT